MKKIAVLLLCAVCLLTVSAGPAWAKGASSPKKALQTYYDAWYKMDFTKAYNSLAKLDKDARSLETYGKTTLNQNDFNDLQKLLFDKTSYKIVSINEEKGKDAATAVIEIMSPDENAMGEKIFEMLFSEAFSNMNEEKAMEKILATLKKTKFPIVASKENVKLIKDKEGWHVFFGWAQEAEAEALMDAALKLINTNDLDQLIEARDTYQKALDMGAEESAWREGTLTNLNEKIDKIQAKIGYITKIKVEPETEIIHEPNRWGTYVNYNYKITNNGDRDVYAVILLVELLDADDNVIHERERTVYVDGLKPGATYYDKHGGGRAEGEVHKTWKEGAIKMTVKEVRLAGEGMFF